MSIPKVNENNIDIVTKLHENITWMLSFYLYTCLLTNNCSFKLSL